VRTATGRSCIANSRHPCWECAGCVRERPRMLKGANFPEPEISTGHRITQFGDSDTHPEYLLRYTATRPPSLKFGAWGFFNPLCAG
jgi:hypothetical protein